MFYVLPGLGSNHMIISRNSVLHSQIYLWVLINSQAIKGPKGTILCLVSKMQRYCLTLIWKLLFWIYSWIRRQWYNFKSINSSELKIKILFRVDERRRRKSFIIPVYELLKVRKISWKPSLFIYLIHYMVKALSCSFICIVSFLYIIVVWQI